MMAIRQGQIDKIVKAIKERGAAETNSSRQDRDKLARLDAAVEAARRNATTEEYKAAIIKASRD
ncbi:hypothetical protein ACFXJ8_25915 [Nonomuraea sp. NPDC059194]|uniref:hypothetical protein n=1 Tax=Nonomuraea sp. NPDC059194 TaxID=3346764 RepID=UPI00369AEE0C